MALTFHPSFLYVIAAINIGILLGIVRVFRAMRSGRYDEAELEEQLSKRGLMNRVLGRLTRTVTRPGQMYPIGITRGAPSGAVYDRWRMHSSRSSCRAIGSSITCAGSAMKNHHSLRGSRT